MLVTVSMAMPMSDRASSTSSTSESRGSKYLKEVHGPNWANVSNNLLREYHRRIRDFDEDQKGNHIAKFIDDDLEQKLLYGSESQKQEASRTLRDLAYEYNTLKGAIKSNNARYGEMQVMRKSYQESEYE